MARVGPRPSGMRFFTRFAFPTLLALSACGPIGGEGGANGNDRTNGGQNGDVLLTGAMVVSPDGAYAVMQRNTVSVLVDIQKRTAKELPFQGERFLFAKNHPVLFAVKPNRGGVVAFDLDAGTSVLWTTTPAFNTTASALLLRISDDDRSLVLGDYDRVFVLDATSGSIRGTVSVGSVPTDVAFVGPDKALIVGSVRWPNHQPATAVVHADLTTLASTTIDVPNCDAPIAVLPDHTRAFLSPTYCEEGKATNPNGQWTNPDPVSVIDLDANGPHFLKNLPGFGPVAMSKDGARVVAYLDTKRMDPAMFVDKKQVPSTSGDSFHLMVIDPTSLAFTLSPIGNALPRFAMTLDGHGLLVDATVKALRGGAYANVTLGPDGLVAEAGVFGGVKSPFGYFDLDARAFTAFQGPGAALDRFVQTKDGKVYTLKTQSDGLGGALFSIDLGTKTTVDLSRSLRDVGILPDGRTLILRIRLPAASINGQLFTQEDYCFATDPSVCDFTIHYQSKTPVPSCEHDCY